MTVEFQILCLIKRTKYLSDEKKSTCWAEEKERHKQSSEYGNGCSINKGINGNQKPGNTAQGRRGETRV